MGAAGNKKPKKNKHSKHVPSYLQKSDNDDNNAFKKKK